MKIEDSPSVAVVWERMATSLSSNNYGFAGVVHRCALDTGTDVIGIEGGLDIAAFAVLRPHAVLGKMGAAARSRRAGAGHHQESARPRYRRVSTAIAALGDFSHLLNG